MPAGFILLNLSTSRIHMLVPEARVVSTSKSLSDNCMMETSLLPVQQLLAAQKEKTAALKRKTDEVGKESHILKAENSILKRQKKSAEKEKVEARKANSILSEELQGSMPSAIFSRAPPIGRNARIIRKRINDELSTLQNEVDNAQDRNKCLKSPLPRGIINASLLKRRS